MKLRVLSLLLAICVAGLVCAYGQAAGSAKIPAELVGEWHNGNVSMLQYQNRTTGATTPGNSSTFTYKFYADGRFEFIGMMQSTMYNCTTTLFNEKNGKVVVEGSKMTLIPSRNFWRNANSCAPNSTKEKNHVLDEETKEWTIKQDEQGRRLICLSDGKAESCFRQQKNNE
ncbi:MAG TPA: hypothetical protein VF666_11515 [Pyrinomonadaceae bacterium]